MKPSLVKIDRAKSREALISIDLEPVGLIGRSGPHRKGDHPCRDDHASLTMINRDKASSTSR